RRPSRQRQSSTYENESALFDGQRLPAAIKAAARASSMGKDRLAAFRAAGKLRRRQSVVRTAFVFFGFRSPSLRNRHGLVYPFFSFRARGRKDMRKLEGLLMHFHVAEDRHPRIGVRAVAAAVALVQIDAAARAQPAAVLVAERPCRQRQQDLLADERLEIQLFAAVEAQSELAGVELLVLRRARIRRKHEIEFL